AREWEPVEMLSRGDIVIAGLVLIPVGIALALTTDSTLGLIVIVGGWILTVGALTAAVLRPHGVVDTQRGYHMEIILTLGCAAVAAIAASVLAGTAVSWVALLWFTAAHWRSIA
ncbi:MAG: hypothetical protein M3355_02375, partial [Actinomycetota bacterium]|nr:hypothetical protein [Actinomycetota bacterium]